MRMRQYICHTDHNLWDIIVDGDLQEETTPAGEQSSPPAPKTAKQLTAKRSQERVKSILLLAILDEYLLKFHNELAFLSSENKAALMKLVLPVEIWSYTMEETIHASQSSSIQQIVKMTWIELDIRIGSVAMKGHFAKECKSGRNQGKRSYSDNGRRNTTTNEPSSQALVAQDGLGGYDWRNDFDELVNYALMAISSSSSSSSSDNEGYELALESLESRILGHEKNELAWGENTSLKTMSLSKTNEVNIEKTKSVHKSVVSKPKINRDKIIIVDWNSDDEDDVSEVNTVSPIKTNETQTVKTQVDKIGQISQKKRIGFKKIKACFVWWSNQYGIMLKGPNGKRAVHTVSSAMPISTARPFASKLAQTGSAIRLIYPRMDNVRPRASYSPIKRSYYTKPSFRPKNLKQDVKTSRVKNMTTTGTRAVVNTGKGKMNNDLKKSRWVWTPKGNYMDHESKEKGSFILKKFEYGNPEIWLQDHAVVDSGCSSHMTGNKAYLSDYEDYNGGFVAFGSDPKGGKITGKGKIITANLDFDDVYFVDELKFNLFSVSQMCDKKNSVLFTDTECFILSPSFKLLDENQVVLRAPRQNGVYSLDLKNIVPSR
ncbi:hypothetical protein Tco_0956867, partial [Tanacetum coccineum]